MDDEQQQAGSAPGARSDWPWWVRFALYGLRRRAWALASVWLSVLLGTAGMVGGFWHPFAYVVAVFFLAAWWYWSALRWVDRRGRWEEWDMK